MKAIELENITSDITLQGIAAEESINSLSIGVAQLNTQVHQLENELISMQFLFEKAMQTGTDQTNNLAMISLLRQEIRQTKEELKSINPEVSQPIKTEIKQETSSITIKNENFETTSQALEGLNSSMEVAIAGASLLGMEHDHLSQIQTKLQAAITITNGLKKIANLLNGEDIVGTGLLARAKGMLTVANGALATSLGISTVAAQALMATLTLGLSVVITGLVWAWGEYSKSQAKAREEAEAFRTKVSDMSSSSVADFKKLNMEYEALGNNLEAKKKFINENQEAFNKLGISITDVNDAENLFNNGGEKFITSLSLRAKAAAAMEMATEKYKQAIKSHMEAQAMPDTFTYYTSQGMYGPVTAQTVKNQDKTQAYWNYKTFSDEGDSFIRQSITYSNQSKNVQKGSNIKSTEEAERARKEKEEKEKTLERAKAQAETERKEYADLIRQAAEAEIRARQQYGDMVIAAMKEGAEKQRAQTILNWEREVENISKDQQQRLELNKKIRKKGGTPKQTDETINKDAENKKQLADETMQKQLNNIDSQDLSDKKAKTEQLLTTYQDAARQRLDIEKKYDADIAYLQEERRLALEKGDAERAQQLNVAMAQAVSKKGQELMSHDLEQLKQDPGYIKAFENLKATSSETLRSLFEQLEEAKQEAEGVLSPAQLKEYTAAMQQVMDELDSRNPFQALIDRKQELADAQEALAKAKSQLDAVNSGAQIITGVKSSKYNKETGKIESEKSYLNGKIAAENYASALSNVKKKSIDASEAEKTVNDAINELGASVKALGASIGGPTGEIISLIGEIGSFTMAAMSGLDTAAEGSASAIQKVEKASVILAIVGAAIQIAMKIASIFKEDDGIAAYEDAKKVYESYIDILDKVIEKQKELFNLNSETGKQAYEKAKTTIATQESASRDLGKQYLDAGASKGFMGIGSSASHGVSQRKDISSKAWNEAKSALGGDFYAKGIGDGRMTGLFDLSVKQLEQLQSSAPLFWAELHDDTRKYLEQIIACGDSLEEIENDRKAGLTSTDFESFASSFLDVMKDMDSTSQDFADSFESYLQNAILSSLLTSKYKSKIQGLYDNWASYTDSGNELTKAEAESLRQEQEKLAAQMLSDRESLKNSFGWKSESESESAQQSPQSAAFSTMSQEQGTKLEGLFTSVQDHVSGIDTNVADISKSMYEASDSLAVIARNTSYCHHLEQMAQDISELKRDGIKMK